MFMSSERLSQLSKLVQQSYRASNFLEFVAQALNFLRSCGFRAARYYECAHSLVNKDDVLILACQQGPNQQVPLGYSIEYRLSTLGLNADPYTLAIGCSRDTNHKWVADLGLAEDSCWVDIPVRSKDRMIGLLAADWSSGDGRLSEEELGLLSSIGSVVANVCDAVSVSDETRIEAAFTQELKKADLVEDALKMAAGELVNTMGFGVVSVFEQSLGGTRLRKIHERVHAKVGKDIAPFDEEYEPGALLTGLAWEKPEYRHIVDFEAFQAQRPHDLKSAALDRHTSLLGRIVSILYSKIESTEARYMIRMVNCVDSPLPIVAAQRAVVDRITQTIAVRINDVVSRQRLEHVLALAREASRHITRPKRVIDYTRQIAHSEGFDDLFVLAKHKNQDIGAVLCEWPSGYQLNGDALLDWSRRPLADLLHDDGAIRVHSRPIAHLAQPATHPVFSWLKEQGYQCLLTKPFQAASIEGVLGIPSRESIKPISHQHGRSCVGQLIDTYASIICSCIEGFDSHVTAEGSRKFMGRIGHEVRRPALSSTQAAISGLAKAKKALLALPSAGEAEIQGIITGIDSAVLSVNEKSKEVDRMMNFAKLAALQEVGSVPFNFSKVNLGALLRTTIDSLAQQGELSIKDKDGRLRHCTVTTNEALDELGDVNADPFYLDVIFSNLLRNAAKYSLPRHAGKPMQIRILAQPQPAMAIVQIENWGVGIDQNEFETIFRSHVRGKSHDKRKAISGLGLGLYVSRLLVHAHGGTIFCRRSTPTLDDPERRKIYEGFETVFEVRLPRAGPVGVKDIDLGGQKT